MKHVGSVVFLLCLVGAECGTCDSEGNGTCHSVIKRSILFIEKKTCYQDLGCFSSGPPFYHPIYRPISVPPQPPELIKTMFLLYTRKNRNRPIIILPHRPRAIRKSTYNPKVITRMIIHGLNDNLAINTWFHRMKDVLLDRSDENIFIVDWSGSNRFPYTIAVANARVVGAEIARFIHYLYKSEDASPESFHLIGHSLGAHVAGYAGERLRKLGRITGLDPAGPFFRHVPDTVRLDPNDAVFVDVIHTDPGTSILQGFGTPEDGGDLDFYPGGGDPPGCDQTIVRSITEDMPTEAISNLVSCQHFRAHEFFIFSFNQNGCLFVGVECSSWEEFLKGHCNCGGDGHKCALMGIFAPTYTFPNGEHHRDRRLFLKVGPERPYCVHQYQVILHLHTLNKYKTYGFESMYVEMTITGRLEKLKGKIRLDVNLAESNQIKKFLLSADRHIGEVEYAIVVFHQAPHIVKEVPYHASAVRTSAIPDTIVDKMEINYLFPLPKSHTSSFLCRTSEESTISDKKFILTANVCH